MKKLFIILLFPLGLTAQTVKVSTSSNLSAPVVPTQAGMTAAIATQAKAQATIDAKQDAALESAKMPVDTTKYLKIGKDGKLTVLQDPLVVTTMSQLDALRTGCTSQVILLQSADNKLFSAIATLQAQNTAMQLQLNTQQALIDKLTAQLAILIDWQTKVKAANQ